MMEHWANGRGYTHRKHTHAHVRKPPRSVLYGQRNGQIAETEAATEEQSEWGENHCNN